MQKKMKDYTLSFFPSLSHFLFPSSRPLDMNKEERRGDGRGGRERETRRGDKRKEELTKKGKIVKGAKKSKREKGSEGKREDGRGKTKVREERGRIGKSSKGKKGEMGGSANMNEGKTEGK